MLEKSSVQTLAFGSGGSGFHSRAAGSACRSSVRRAMTTHSEDSFPGDRATNPCRTARPGQHHGPDCPSRVPIEATIGDVECQNPVLGKLVQVETKRFPRGQMNGNRVGAERIHGNQVVVMIVRVFQAQSGVPENDIKFWRG